MCERETRHQLTSTVRQRALSRKVLSNSLRVEKRPEENDHEVNDDDDDAGEDGSGRERSGERADEDEQTEVQKDAHKREGKNEGSEDKLLLLLLSPPPMKTKEKDTDTGDNKGFVIHTVVELVVGVEAVDIEGWKLPWEATQKKVKQCVKMGCTTQKTKMRPCKSEARTKERGERKWWRLLSHEGTRTVNGRWCSHNCLLHCCCWY